MSDAANRRILLIDDNPGIHEDFRKILGRGDAADAGLDAARAAFLGEASAARTPTFEFRLDSALQGEEGLHRVLEAQQRGEPFAMAFVDVRMPPGWDGVETIDRIWQADPELQIVVCTAFSDYSWDDMIERLGHTDRLLILKKPFDPIEVCQLATALTEKWNVTHRERQRMEELRVATQEAHAYAASLETMNRALEASKAAADRSAALKTSFLIALSRGVRARVADLLERGREADRGPLEPPVRDLIESLDEITDLSRIECGEARIETERFSPFEVVETVLAGCRDFAERRDVTLEQEFRGPVPETIQGDAVRVGQILYHLVDNAIAVGRGGRVTVGVAVEERGNWSNPNIAFTVTDEGPGIPHELLGALFEPKEPGGEGVGMGLAVSKRLAQLMGGDLRVQSAPGQGSRFTLLVETGPLTGVKLIECDEAPVIDGELFA